MFQSRRSGIVAVVGGGVLVAVGEVVIVVVVGLEEGVWESCEAGRMTILGGGEGDCLSGCFRTSGSLVAWVAVE